MLREIGVPDATIDKITKGNPARILSVHA